MFISQRLSSDVVESGLGHGVEYRPEFADELGAARIGEREDVWIVHPGVTANVVESWRRAVLARGGRPALIGEDRRVLEGCARAGVELLGPCAPQGGRSLDLALLAAAERAELRRICDPRWRALGVGGASAPWSGSRSVCLLGAGIVNLMTALALSEAGYRVEVVDAGPDPRLGGDWRRHGATCGGANARMFCLTEADNYNEKGDKVYADMFSALSRRISQGGWLVDTEGTRAAEFRSWVDHFKSVPAWRAKIFADDIHGVNRSSGALWSQMRDSHRTLFDDAVCIDGVLRVYSEVEAFEAAVATQTRVGALRRALRPAELSRAHPGLAAACAQGAIAGGIEVVGFTLNIHNFVNALITHLEAHGAHITWDTRATWERENDVVVGVRLDSGALRSADHYVASPGAYGHDLLVGTRCEGLVTGIAGLWMVLPNLDPPLRHSLKIHREGHVGEDSNVTIALDHEGREVLLLGSGYAIVGQQSELKLDDPEIRSLYRALLETVRRFFPAQHELGPEVGWRVCPRGCVRAFTPTGLGLFDGFASSDGLVLITGGHNTGGFAQAPSVADAVVRTLRGQACAMQSTFAPGRGLA